MFLLCFFAEHNKTRYYVPSSKYKTIKPGIRYLEEHYINSQLRDIDLAKAAGISTLYFRNLFIHKFGTPPMKYVSQERIERAKIFLSSGFYTTISDVAIDSDFAGLYHFSKVFKQDTALTPCEFSIAEKSNARPNRKAAGISSYGNTYRFLYYLFFCSAASSVVC